MRILITGPESSGTKALTRIFNQLGAGVTHSSPNYLWWQGGPMHKAEDFDAVIVIIRSGFPTARSMVKEDHATDIKRGMIMQAQAIQLIFENLASYANVFIITNEHLSSQPKAMQELVEAVGLTWKPDLEEFLDRNSQYYD